MSYNLSYPMSYETFKSMPLDLQQKYLDDLASRFGAGMSTISKDLFNKSAYTLSLYVNSHGLRANAGKKMGAKARSVWERWLCREVVNFTAEVIPDGVEVEPRVVITPCEEHEEAPVVEVREARFEVSDLAATFAGEFDPAKFLKWVAMLPIPGNRVKIRLEVTSDVQ